MRVAVDITSLLEPPTGVGRTTRSMIEALVTHTDLELSCFAVSWRGRRRLREEAPVGTAVAGRPVPARLVHRLWSHVALPWAEILTGSADVVHGPNYVVPPPRRAAAVVSVHDLTFFHYPQFCNPAVLGFPKLVQKAIDRGAWVHTGAEAIATEIRDRFDVEAEKVVAIHHGLDAALAPLSPGEAQRRPIDSGRYVLALGTIEPRKDHASLVAAFDLLAGDVPDLRLVIAGAEGWGAEPFHRALAAARHRDRIDMVGYVSEVERAAVLRHAAVLAYPSRYEGFGLPPLEAMQVDVPVVTTDAGSLPEVVGDAAEIARTGDAESLASALRRALDPERRVALIAAGRANLQRFDWSTTALRLSELYRRAASA